MSLRPLRTFRIVAQKPHQRAADWIRLLLLQPMTGAIKQSVFLHSRASARSHHIDGAGVMYTAQSLFPPKKADGTSIVRPAKSRNWAINEGSTKTR